MTNRYQRFSYFLRDLDYCILHPTEIYEEEYGEMVAIWRYNTDYFCIGFTDEGISAYIDFESEESLVGVLYTNYDLYKRTLYDIETLLLDLSIKIGKETGKERYDDEI